MVYNTIKNEHDLILQYEKLISNEVKDKDLVLYVGWESDDILFDILKKKIKKIVIVEKNNIEFSYKDYKFINDNILNIFKYIDNNMFDVGIISFALHENNHLDRMNIIKILKLICNKIILIEPLKREDKCGIIFENFLLKYNKFYETLSYWEHLLINYNKKIFLKRNKFIKIRIKTNEYKYILKIKLQNIIILIWEKEKDNDERYNKY